MEFIKKQSGGFYSAVLTSVFAAAGLICYLINCNTDYFGNLGINGGLAACLIVGIMLEIAYVVCAQRMGTKIYTDAFPVICGGLFTAALVIFITCRVAGIASIMTFENNAKTMADMQSAVIGMVLCLLAMICNIVTAFLRVVREQ